MTPLAICNLRLDSPRGCALLMAWHPGVTSGWSSKEGWLFGRKTMENAPSLVKHPRFCGKNCYDQTIQPPKKWSVCKIFEFQNNPLVSSIQHQPSPRWPCLPLQWFHFQYLRCPPRFVGYVSDKKKPGLGAFGSRLRGCWGMRKQDWIRYDQIQHP